VEPGAEACLVVPIAKARVALERDGQRLRGQVADPLADAPRGVGQAGGRIEGWETEAWVAHDARVYRPARGGATARGTTMDGVSDPQPPPVPGERRLERPPSERFREPPPPIEATASAGSAGRGVAFGLVAAVAGSVATVILGGALAVSAGLLVVAAACGWAIGLAVRVGAAGALAAGSRAAVAVALAGLAVALGQLGLWLYARTEGGVLGPVDYLGQTFGLLVPAQVLLALAAAWRAAR
jgi:hypothetical protein